MTEILENYKVLCYIRLIEYLFTLNFNNFNEKNRRKIV